MPTIISARDAASMPCSSSPWKKPQYQARYHSPPPPRTSVRSRPEASGESVGASARGRARPSDANRLASSWAASCARDCVLAPAKDGAAPRATAAGASADNFRKLRRCMAGSILQLERLLPDPNPFNILERSPDPSARLPTRVVWIPKRSKCLIGLNSASATDKSLANRLHAQLESSGFDEHHRLAKRVFPHDLKVAFKWFCVVRPGPSRPIASSSVIASHR